MAAGSPRRFAPASLVGAAILLATLPTQGVTPVPGTLPGQTQTTINNGAGNQTDPHVSGDIAVYTADTGDGLTQIRYYEFATNGDSGIPNAGGFDLLSNIGGSTIVFTRVGSGKQAIFAFDAAAGGPLVELDPLEGSRRRGAAIGGTTVAWIDLAAGSAGEIAVYDLATGLPAQVLTNNSLVDRRVAVSPDGNVIVWEQCASATANCDIYQAIKGAGGWTVSAVTGTPDHESFPDTNGTIVVYASSRSSSLGGPDVYWTPVAGGAEQHLELAGTEQNPNVSGDLIVFEGLSPGASMFDLFAYDVSTNNLYQLTNTPSLSETLNDVWVSPTRVARVVWSVFEGADENVYGTTFQLPTASVVDTIEELIALVESYNLHQGIENSMDAKLQNASRALESKRSGETAVACSLIDAFKNEVVAQSGNALTVDQAVELLAAADRVKAALGCV